MSDIVEKAYKDTLGQKHKLVTITRSFIITESKGAETVWWRWNGKAVSGNPKGEEISLVFDSTTYIKPKQWKKLGSMPIKCFLCSEEAVAICYFEDGCTCAKNIIQPRCQHHINRVLDSGDEFEILEDFRIPITTNNTK